MSMLLFKCLIDFFQQMQVESSIRSNRFVQKSSQISIKPKKKLTNVRQALYIQHDNTFNLLLSSADEALNVINQAGQVKWTYKKGANSSNLIQINFQKAAFYSPASNKIVTINLPQFKAEQKSIEIQPNESPNEFQLVQFKSLQCIALIQKNNRENILSISYFKQQENEFKILANYKTQPKQWDANQKTFKINENGLIGWSRINSQGIDIHLCSLEQGFKKGSFENICSLNVQVASILNDGSNFIHLALVFKSPSLLDNLPVLVIQTSNNFSNFQKVRFAENNSQAQFKFSEVTEVNTHGKYIIFKAIVDKNLKKFVYDLQTQTIIRQFQTRVNSTLNIIVYPLTLIAQYEFNESKQQLVVNFKPLSFTSEAVMNVLQNIDKVIKISKKSKAALVVFGASKSGKSTYRNFLCRKKLQHIYHQELGFYQLKCIQPHAKIQEDNSLAYVDQSQKGAVIEFPEFTEFASIKPEVLFILQYIFKTFKNVHLAVTIPIQQIEQPETYQQSFQGIVQLTQKLGLKLSQSELGNIMSIVLTKVQDSDSTQLFEQQVQLLKDQNQRIGNILGKIIQNQRLFSFENKQYQVGQQQQDVQKLFASPSMLLVEEKMYKKLQHQIISTSEGQNFTKSLHQEDLQQYKVMNSILLYLSHKITSVPQNFSIQNINQTLCYNSLINLLSSLVDQSQNLIFGNFFKENKKGIDENQLAQPFFRSLAGLKLVIENKANQTPQKISDLHNNFQLLAEKYKQISNQKQSLLLNKSIRNFISALAIEIQYLIDIKSQKTISSAIKVLKDGPYSILGKIFKPIIQKLSQNQAVSSQRALLQQLSQYFGRQRGRVLRKVVKRQMTYEEERQFYLKNKPKTLQYICNLPANPMKLDLILEQIFDFMKKQKIQEQDFRKIRFYLREASRICRFHEKFVEAIILLMVIPDFIGIQVLLDEMVEFCKNKSALQSKKLFNNAEDDLIDQLIVICRQCVRDSLVSKLIYIKSLNKEVNQKQNNIKKFETQSRNKQLSKRQGLKKYLEKLQKQSELCFYNLKNESFKKLIENRAELIEQCINFQKNQPMSSRYTDIQALDWVVQKMQTPV